MGGIGGPIIWSFAKVWSWKQLAKDIHAREALAMEWMSRPMKSSIQKTEAAAADTDRKEDDPKNNEGGDDESNTKPSNIENKVGLGSSSSEAPSSTAASVGDGGLGWRLRALKRAKERAEREGTSVNSEVEARWGSLDNVVSDLEKESSSLKYSGSRSKRLGRDGESRREKRDPDSGHGRRDYSNDARDSSWKRGASYRDERPSGRWRKNYQEERRLQSEAKDIISDVKALARAENQKPADDEDARAKDSGQADVLNFKDPAPKSDREQREPEKQPSRVERPAAGASLAKLTSGGSNHKFAAMLRDRLRKGSGAGAFDDIKQAAAHERSAATDLQAALVDDKGMSRTLQARARAGSEGPSGSDYSVKAMQLRERLDVDDDNTEVREELKRHKGTLTSLWKTKPYFLLPPFLSLSLRLFSKLPPSCLFFFSSLPPPPGFFSGAEYDPELEYEDVNLNEDANRRKLSAKDMRRESRRKESERGRIVAQERRDARQLELAKDKSWYTRFQNLLFAVSPRTYCMVPPSRECPLFFGDGHCLIVARDADPKGGTRSADEDTWEEFRNFKKCLMLYGASLSPPREFIFAETVLREAKHRYHTYIEAIPVPKEVVRSAPVWYRKVEFLLCLRLRWLR